MVGVYIDCKTKKIIMKIEIELEDVEQLKWEIAHQKEEIAKLKEELKNLDKKELHKQAVTLSKILFNDYMTAVFSKLGFHEGWQRDSVNFENNLEHWLGKDWWHSDRLTIGLRASISKEWKRAFLDMGIITKKDNDE